MAPLLNYIVIRRIQTMTKAISDKEKSKDTKVKRKTKLERATEAQLFLEQSELQKQLEAEEINTETLEPKPIEVHEPHIVRRLRKL